MNRIIKTLCLAATASTLLAAPVTHALTIQFVNVVNLPMWDLGSSIPAPNTSLDTPPKYVMVSFSSGVRPEGSGIKVYDPYNNLLQTEAPVFNGNNMTVNLPPLTEGYTGTYRVEWTAYCQCNDTRSLSGSYYFNIR